MKGTSCEICTRTSLPGLLDYFREQILESTSRRNQTDLDVLKLIYPLNSPGSNSNSQIALLLEDLNPKEFVDEVKNDVKLATWQKDCQLLKRFAENPNPEFKSRHRIDPTLCGSCISHPYHLCIEKYCHNCPTIHNGMESNPLSPEFMKAFFNRYGPYWKNQQYVDDFYGSFYSGRHGELRENIPPETIHQTLFGKPYPTCSSLLSLQRHFLSPSLENPIALLPYSQNSCYCDSVLSILLGIPNDYVDGQLNRDLFETRLDKHRDLLRNSWITMIHDPLQKAKTDMIESKVPEQKSR